MLLAALLVLCGINTGVADNATETLENLYSEAILMMATGKYAEAAKRFDSISVYRDSTQMAIYCKAVDYAENKALYQVAVSALKELDEFKDSVLLAQYYKAREEEDYASKVLSKLEDSSISDLSEAIQHAGNAIRQYNVLVPFRDCDERMAFCISLKGTLDNGKTKREQQIYDAGNQYEKNGRYIEAIAEYRKLEGKDDINNRIKYCAYMQGKEYENEAEYDKAIVYYEIAEDYEDSVESILRCIYSHAKSLMVETRYEEAETEFRLISNYKDSQKLGNECAYLRADNLMSAGKFEEAEQVFRSIPEYKDSTDKANGCAYLRATIQMNHEHYVEAANIFSSISEYKDSNDKADECTYLHAEKLMASGKYREAEDVYRSIQEYKDSLDKANECIYISAEKLMIAEKYEEAESVYRSISAYKDSSEKADECVYLRAGGLLTAEKYEEASKIYYTIPDYKDAEEKGTECLYLKAAALERSNDFENARSLYKIIRTYKDSAQCIDYIDALKKEKDGQLLDATEVYLSLGTFRDSAERAVDCIYRAAKEYEEQNQYDEAGRYFSRISDYKDSTDRLYRCIYLKAKLMHAQKNYEDAIDIYSTLGDYKDSSDLLEQCRSELYDTAVDYQNNGQIYLAYSTYLKLGDYKDSREKAETIKTEATYDHGWISIHSGEYASAFNIFESLGDYSNSKELAYACSISNMAEMERLTDQIALIRFHDLYGFVHFGKEITVVKPQHKELSILDNDRLIFKDKEGKLGVVRTDNKILIDSQYDSISEFIEQMVICRENTSLDLYNADGRLLFAKVKAIEPFNQYLKVKENNNSVALFDYSGNRITSSYDSIEAFSDSTLKAVKNRQCDLLDFEGRKLLTDYNALVKHSSGLILGQKAQKAALYSYQGQKKSKDYDSISANGTDGIYCVTDKLDKQVLIGFISQDGMEIVEPRYIQIGNQSGKNVGAPVFSEGYVSALTKDNTWTWLDKNGHELFTPKAYEAVSEFHGGFADVKEHGAWNIIDTNGTYRYFVNDAFIHAVQLMNDGEYLKAINEFDQIEERNCVQEALEMKNRCIYLYALELEEKENTGEALSYFEKLGDYEDAVTRAKRIHFNKGVAYEKEQTLEDALKEYLQAEGYENADEAVNRVRYNIGRGYFDDGEYETAIQYFLDIKDYLNAEHMIVASYNQMISEPLSRHAYNEALNILKEERIINVSSLIKKVHYENGLYLLNNNDYDGAYAKFGLIKNYKDSADMMKECLYRKAAELFDNGQYIEALNIYESISEYKDVTEILDEPEFTFATVVESFKQVGNIVTYGTFEQDNDLGNGKEPIEWNILDIQDGKALLVSQYALIEMPMDSKKNECTWGSSSLRKWLNQDFLNEAFSKYEQKAIVLAEVDNHINRTIGTGEENTVDQVYLLSYHEIEKYYNNNVERICYATPYAMSTLDTTKQVPVTWWLRTGVYPGKLIYCVFSQGIRSSAPPTRKTTFVRPVIRVDIEMLGKAVLEQLTQENETETVESESELSEPETKKTVIGKIRIKDSGIARVRSAPDTDAQQIGKLKSGTICNLISVSEDGWFEVEYGDEKIGYVHPNMATIVK